MIVPVVTPFDDEFAFDRSAIPALIEHVVGGGADGIMPTALTGEGPLLSEEETLLVWETVFDCVEGRCPVVPAVISFTTARAVRLARRADELGADGIMVAPIVPELYAGRSDRDVLRFYRDVASATELPMVLFNYPSLTGIDLHPSLVEQLAELENIRSIKESTGDSRRISALTRRLGHRIDVVCGAPNAALESMALGCTTWITGVTNVVPQAAKALLRAVHEQGDLVRAREIYYHRILPLVDVLSQTNNPTGTIKAGLRAQGVQVGSPRPPGQDLLDEELLRLDGVLREAGLVVLPRS